MTEQATLAQRRDWVLLSLAILLFFCVGGIFLALFVTPKFQQIFNDALGPDHPLPTITGLILSSRILLALIAFAWAVAAIILVRLRSAKAIYCINLGIIWILLQAAITVIALFLPMVTNISGLSDAH
jgi:hypothetical protein